MTSSKSAADVGALVDDRSANGVFRVNKEVFLDPAVFEDELNRIFESSWVYLCHESQLKNPGDYFATYIGRQPVFVVRQKDSSVRGFLNACPHRSQTLLPLRQGTIKSAITCRFHGWVFNTDGRCMKVKNEAQGGYLDGAVGNGSCDLAQLPRLQGYRGFIFGSLSPMVPELADFLGPAATFMDLFADQSPHGIEILRGTSKYICRHNWKIQFENVVDGYHVSTVHRNFATTIAQREARGGVEGMLKTETGRIQGMGGTGCYDLGNGHMAAWADRASPAAAPLFPETEQIRARFSSAKSDWMLRRGRNLAVFPNLVLNDLASTHLRTIRPLSVDKCEVNLWCIAPVGESADARYARLRKFEDFFLVTGMATSDDVVSLDSVQTGSSALGRPWTDYARGMATMVQGPDEHAKELGFIPVTSNSSFDHETPYHGMYRHWKRVMEGSGVAATLADAAQ